MDNMNGMNMNGIPPVQPIQPATPNMGQPGVTGAPIVGAPGAPGMPGAGVPGQPMIQQVPPAAMPKKDISGLVKTIVIIGVSLIAVTFIGLFIWMSMNWREAQTDLDTKIAVAVAEAKDEQAAKLESEFLEREKYPYKTFSGPVDYGQLTFEYPKTWSVYVAEPATTGGDFHAYFNPIQVDSVGEKTVNALRLSILNKSIDEVSEEYRDAMEDDDIDLTMVSTTIGLNNNITANRYTGMLPDTEGLVGYIVTFKIRDKTAILQTDSVLFEEDYNKLLGTVVFNE